jgi:hypothetical protein
MRRAVVGVYAGIRRMLTSHIRRMLTSQFLKWRIPTSRKWEQGRMLTFNFVEGRAYNHLYF